MDDKMLAANRHNGRKAVPPRSVRAPIRVPVNPYYIGGLGLLVAAAFVLLLLEVKSPGIGALGIVGGVTLFAGLLVMFNMPGTPDFARISIPGAIAISVVTQGFSCSWSPKRFELSEHSPSPAPKAFWNRSVSLKRISSPPPMVLLYIMAVF